MPTAQDLLLLTGATGFIGFRTLVRALEAGYSVRCAIRKESKASEIKATPAIKALNLSDSALTFSAVPDITVSGAFDEVMKDVTHVIHVASPLASQNMEGYKNAEEVFIKPAVSGALEMLRAAKRSLTVRKVVITSSMVALMPPSVFGGIETSDKLYTADSRTAHIDGPYATSSVAYCASKIAALNATDDWIAQERPDFDVVNVYPSWVVGPADLVHSREEFLQGTNKYMVAVSLGKVNEITGEGRKLAGTSVHVDDVALIQVMALRPDLHGYRGFVASTTMTWDDIATLTPKVAPDGVKEGIFVTNGRQATSPVNLLTSDTESTLDFKFKNLEEQVKDTLGQYLNLPEKV